MIQKIQAPITVITTFNHKTRVHAPVAVKWDGQTYKIKKIGFHHTQRKGRILYHVYSVSSDELFFRIVLNTETLNWVLEEISDGLPD